MRFFVLADDTVCTPGMESEHGLSLLIDYRDHMFLFDTGKSSMFLRNADRMGIDLKDAQFCVLSHGHYDHSGGVDTFLNLVPEATVYAGDGVFDRHLTTTSDGATVDIGVSMSYAHRQNVLTVGDRYDICRGLTMFESKSSDYPMPTSNRRLSVYRDGKGIPDDFTHERNLIVTEGGRNVLVTGCAHRGICNILKDARAIAGRIDAVVGGFHLSDPRGTDFDSAETEQFCDLLGDTKCFGGHCTGEKPLRMLERELGDSFSPLGSGNTFDI